MLATLPHTFLMFAQAASESVSEAVDKVAEGTKDLVEAAAGAVPEAAEEASKALISLHWQNIGYLVAAVLFILGIKGMTHPKTSVRGNLLGAVGMFIAVLVTLLQREIPAAVWIAGILVGGVGGVWMARTVQMTQMPQLVALFNGFGGIASVLVAGAEVIKAANVGIPEGADPKVFAIACGLTGLIGAVTFTGSLVAAAKLEELPRFKNPFSFKGQQAANAAMLVLCLLLTYQMIGSSGWEYILLVLIAFVLGVLLVSPIGGADMPVVIALLNSYSGLAAAAAGFVISNNVLIIAGSLVGASGLILTSIMCKAMNRSLANVHVRHARRPAPTAPSADDVYAGKIKSDLRRRDRHAASTASSASSSCRVTGMAVCPGPARRPRPGRNLLESQRRQRSSTRSIRSPDVCPAT